MGRELTIALMIGVGTGAAVGAMSFVMMRIVGAIMGSGH